MSFVVVVTDDDGTVNVYGTFRTDFAAEAWCVREYGPPAERDETYGTGFTAIPLLLMSTT